MNPREYTRICKQEGCGAEFVVSAPSIENDRAIGLSEPEYCPKHRLYQVRSYSRIACHHLELEMTPEGEKLVRSIEARLAAFSPEQDGKVFDPWDPPPKGYGPGGIGRFTRAIRSFRANESHQPIKGPQEFQIAERAKELLAKLEQYRVIVLVGTTGSGKSTYIPWLLLTGGEPGRLSKWAKRGPICVTQPRIQATRQVPEFIAHQLNGSSLGPGAQVGFSHSGADEFDRRTRLIFKTDGKLINDIVSGAIANYSIVMIDEAHERSANIDLILGLLKDQLYLYPQLRVIIASATINEQTFLDFFGLNKAQHYVFSQGRQHNIHKHWWGETFEAWHNKAGREPGTPSWEGNAETQRALVEWWKEVNKGQMPTRENLPRAISELVQHICTWLQSLTGSENAKEDGHILVFLPGSREIDQTVGMINALGLANTVALPLYSERPLDEQQAALKPDPEKHKNVYGKRRVVVSTNVAETSLTVDGVKHVVETGFIKESYWNTQIEISELRTVRHSRAGCRQRWGRAGRITDGHAYMFYTEEDFKEFPNESTPAIARSSLEQVVLTAKRAGVRSRTDGGSGTLDFEWMPLPAAEQKEFQQELTRAYGGLLRKGAIDADGDLTAFGLEMGGFPATLEVAKLFTEAEHHALAVEAAALLPFIKLEHGVQSLLAWDQDGSWNTVRKLAVRLAQRDLVFGCEDDLEFFLKLWVLWNSRPLAERERWCEANGIAVTAFTKLIADEYQKLLDATMDWRKAEQREVFAGCVNALRALIASCLPNEVYVPIEEKSVTEDKVTKRDRFDPIGYADSMELEEYDDVLTFDEGPAERKLARSGIYCRRSAVEVAEKDRIEFAPSSICFDREDARLVVACQRLKNWLRPARTKAMAMTLVRLDPQWLETVETGSKIQKARLFARLRRTADESAVLRRLFLPQLAARGQAVEATVEEILADGTVRVHFEAHLPKELKVDRRENKPIQVRGYIAPGDLPFFPGLLWSRGAKVAGTVRGFDIERLGHPVVRLGAPDMDAKRFSSFAARHRGGERIEVEMGRMLGDPMGRNPLFIVRDAETGLEMPMADTDFCGRTRPQASFGLRFQAGERFDVTIETIDLIEQTVVLSRAEQLIAEYLGLSMEDGELIDVTVRRKTPAGIFVDIPSGCGRPYVALVKHSLWPGEVDPEEGTVVEARFRRLERQMSPSEIAALVRDKKPLPPQLDFGIDLDLRGPKAFDRFVTGPAEGGGQSVRAGQLVSALVEKHLDSGGVLVRLAPEVVTHISTDELGIDGVGHLRRARDYRLNHTEYVRVFKIDWQRKRIRCSFFRCNVPPQSLSTGDTIEIEILGINQNRRQSDQVWVTGCYDKKYCVRAAIPARSSQRVTKHSTWSARVKTVDREVACYIRAELDL